MTFFWIFKRQTLGKKTIKNYKLFLGKFNEHFGDYEISNIKSEDILTFLVQNSEGQKQATKRFKYTLVKSFFNFTCTNIDENTPNPCESNVLRKSFRHAAGRQWTILEKDLIDEIIFRTNNPGNRLMLELMARGGMRVSEVLKLKARDVEERKLFIEKPKSGRQSEVVFIPQKVAERLKSYISSKNIENNHRIFPIGYTAARAIVKKSGQIVGINLNAHDLRRHAATLCIKIRSST